MVVFNPLRSAAQLVDLERDAPQLLQAAHARLLTVHVLQSNIDQLDVMNKAAQPSPEPSCSAPPRWSVAVTTNPCSVLHAIRPLYDAMLDVEQLGVAIKERPLPAGEDLCLSGRCCLCVLLADGDMDTQLTSHVPQLLERVSFAYEHAVLLFIPPTAPVAPGLGAVPSHRLYAVGRSLGLAVQVLVARDVPHAQLMLRACLLGAVADAGPTLAELPDEWTARLERAECLNPHSAAAIAATGLLRDGIPRQCIQARCLGALLSDSTLITQALGQHPLVQAVVPAHCLEMLAVVLPHLTEDAPPQPACNPSSSESMPPGLHTSLSPPRQHTSPVLLSRPHNLVSPPHTLPPGTMQCASPEGQQWLQELGLLDSPSTPLGRRGHPLSPVGGTAHRGAPQTDDFGVSMDLISELQGASRHPWDDVCTPPAATGRRSGRRGTSGPPQTTVQRPNFEQFAMQGSTGCALVLHLNEPACNQPPGRQSFHGPPNNPPRALGGCARQSGCSECAAAAADSCPTGRLQRGGEGRGVHPSLCPARLHLMVGVDHPHQPPASIPSRPQWVLKHPVVGRLHRRIVPFLFDLAPGVADLCLLFAFYAHRQLHVAHLRCHLAQAGDDGGAVHELDVALGVEWLGQAPLPCIPRLRVDLLAKQTHHAVRHHL